MKKSTLKVTEVSKLFTFDLAEIEAVVLAHLENSGELASGSKLDFEWDWGQCINGLKVKSTHTETERM